MTVNIYAPTSNDGLSAQERALYDLIMAYRAENSLPSIPLSASLTTVAGRHAMDTRFNIWEPDLALPSGANLHSWSDAPYFSDHRQPEVMWQAPQRLGTDYTGNGYEISAGGYTSIEAALDGWKGSSGHDNVILNKDIWSGLTWNAIGVGLVQPASYDPSVTLGGYVYHVWFGSEADPAGAPATEGTSPEVTPTPTPEVTPAGDLTLTSAANQLVFTTGDDLTVTTPSDLYGDTVRGFDETTTIVFQSQSFSSAHLNFNPATGALLVDHDRNGTPDGSVSFQGDLSGGTFMAARTGANTTVSFEKFLPTLAEGQAVASTAVNGILNEAFLTGDGTSKFQITLQPQASAAHNNMLGVYEINAAGTIVDTRVVFTNTATQEGTSVTVDGVEAGHKLGFFLLQDGANRLATLSASDSLAFTDVTGAPADLADGFNLFFAVNGARQNVTAFHSHSASMNIDSLQHALSGASSDGRAMVIGFEDVIGGGDRDYQDVLFQITPFDTLFT